MKRGIAFFDFDGTIIKRDSLIEMIRYVHGDFYFIIGIATFIPIIIAFKLGFFDRQKSKERLLKFFFGGMNQIKFQEQCNAFSNNVLPKLIRPKALEKIIWHKEQNHKLVIVSASPEQWLREWCSANQISCIATKLEVENGIITGKINGKNCYGQEKVNRILSEFNLKKYDEIYAYGNSKGDLNMISIARFQFYKKLY